MAKRPESAIKANGTPCDEIDTAVGAALRQLRKASGVSQAALGRYLGVSFQQIQKYERGVNRMGASALYRISRFFGIEVGDLFIAVDERAPHTMPDRAVVVFLPNNARGKAVSEAELVAAMSGYQMIADASLRAAVRQLIKRLAAEPKRNP